MNLPQQDNIVLDHRYFLGDFHDHSGNSNHGTPTGVNWEKRPDKHVRFSGTDVITVADSSELQLTQGTIIFYSDKGFANYSSTDRIVSKRDAGGINYTLRFNNAASLSMYDGSTTATAVINQDADSKSIAVSFNSGSVSKAYVNGAYIKDFNTANTWTADDADLLIGNFYTGANPIQDPLKGVLIYNTVLTDEEIAQVHEWIMEQTSPKFQKKNFSFPSLITGKENNILGAWDMKNVHGKIIDKSSNLNDATITDLSQTKDGLYFNESGYANIATSPLSTHTDFSFEAIIVPEASANTNAILVNGTGNGTAIVIFVDPNEDLQFQVEKTSDSTYRRATVPIDGKMGKLTHIMGTYDASEQDLYLYIDNHEIQYSLTTAYTNPLGNSALTFGARNQDFAVPFLGKIKHIRLFDSILTATERAKYYNDFAKLPYFVDDLSDANESVAAEGGTTGTPLSNTEWKFGNATVRAKINSGVFFNNPYAKYIESTTAGGTVGVTSQQAYGTWRFKFNKAESSNLYVLFMADKNDVEGASGQNGYEFIIGSGETIYFRKITNGGTVTLFETDAAYLSAGVDYDVWITRRYDGQFTTYIKGGAFTNWTIIVAGVGGSNPVTDNTHTSSKYTAISFITAAGDKVTDFRYYSGVLTP